MENSNGGFLAATVDLAGFPFWEVLQRNLSRLFSFVPLGCPQICFSCQKNATKNPVNARLKWFPAASPSLSHPDCLLTVLSRLVH